MTGLRGEAAIVGIAELPAEKRQSAPPSFTLDQYARLAKMVIEDAGVDPAVVNGLSTHGIAESDHVRTGDAVASTSVCRSTSATASTSAVRPRRAWCGVRPRPSSWDNATRCLVVMPGSTEVPRSETKPGRTLSWFGASSNNYGSPQAEFEIPYGNVGQNGPYAQIAQRYGA